MGGLLFVFMIAVGVCYGRMAEICLNGAEKLSISCEDNQLIVAQSGSYGRMGLGRCLKDDYKLGCRTDVLFLVDRWCSGRSECSVDVPNAELAKENKCSENLLLYLEVEFHCVAVDNAHECNRGTSQVRRQGQMGTLASANVARTGCGAQRAPWVIEGAPGQRVNVSMLDFAYTPTSSGAKASTMTCEPYGYIVERKLGINRTVCGGVARRSHVYMSASSSVEIYATQARNPVSFIMEYEVIGCADAKPPPNAWYKRMADTAEMGCEWSDTSWQLKCVGNRWVGTFGNCTSARVAESSAKEKEFELHPVLTMGLIIGLAVLVALLLCAIAIGFVCMKRNNKQQQPQDIPENAAMSYPGETMLLPGQMQTFLRPVTPRAPLINQPKQYGNQKADGTTNSDLLHGLGTATIHRGQPRSGESEYLAPCLTGSYLAKKYGAPIYDTVGTRNGTGERNSSAGDGDWVQEGSFQFVTPEA